MAFAITTYEIDERPAPMFPADGSPKFIGIRWSGNR
jgi:hypothetical protein